jgi:hypothetical protein
LPAKEETMLANIATGSLIFALFSGVCAIGVSDSLARITRPITYVALSIAVVLYAMSYFR